MASGRIANLAPFAPIRSRRSESVLGAIVALAFRI